MDVMQLIKTFEYGKVESKAWKASFGFKNKSGSPRR